MCENPERVRREEKKKSVRVRSRKMGAEALSKNEVDLAEAPLVLGFQPSALVDHVARVDWSLLHQISGEHGGSIPVHPSSPLFFLFHFLTLTLTFFTFVISFTRWVLTSFSFYFLWLHFLSMAFMLKYFV